MSTKRSYRQFCGLAAALDVVGERWTLLVVRELGPGPRRFSDLFSGLPGISTDMLVERLRQLERAGALRRIDIRHPAPAKLYELTDRGRKLAGIAASLAMWGAPLLGTPPADDVHVRPQWALQSMVHQYAGGLDDGAYELTIDDDTFTVVIANDTARLVYGASGGHVRLRLACNAERFFQLVTGSATDFGEVQIGSAAMLRRFLARLPLVVGEAAVPTGPGRSRRPARQ